MGLKLLVGIFTLASTISYGQLQEAVLAGGSFWFMDSELENISGVEDVIVGYSGGTIENPTLKEVLKGNTGHRESVLVKYDDEKITYEELLYKFLKKIDPTDDQGQFNDRGEQYSPAIFYVEDSEKEKALNILEKVKVDGHFSQMKVPVIQLKNFYSAEDDQQDYYKKNEFKYKYFKFRSGRDRFLDDHWKNK